MTYDVWEDLNFKTSNFKMYKSVNANVFRISKNKLLFINGNTEDKETLINYYLYDIGKEKFIQERSDKKLGQFVIDNQGNKNYSNGNKIYAYLTDKKVRVFYKDLWYWDNLDVYLMKIEKNKNQGKGLGCCSKRK